MIPDIRSTHPQVLTITPNNSVSRLLLAQIAELQVKEKRHTWEAPQVLSFNAWIKQLWTQSPMTLGFQRPLLLNPVQELAVWQEIIDASHWSGVLMQTTSLARNAIQANRTLAEWRIPVARLKEFSTDEARALQSWVKEFDQRCLKQHWLPSYRLADQLLVLPEQAVVFPPEIRVFTPEELTPQQKSLLDYAEERGSRVHFVEPGVQPGKAVRVALPEREREYDSAASWARERMHKQGDSRIAIALVNKSRQLNELTRSLDRVFYPDSLYPSITEARRYDTGESLALDSEPIIDVALRILSQSHHRVELYEFSAICCSPFLSGSESEFFARCQLDVRLRSYGELNPSLNYIVGRIYDRESERYRVDCPRLYDQLIEWRRCIDGLPSSQNASDWASDFAKILSAIGWPGKYKTDLSKQKILDRFDDALSQLCVLDAVKNSMRQEEALAWLKKMVAETTTPAPRRTGVVHIISIDDVAQLPFDNVWVCGLDDEQWPPASRPNPLIPIALQREFQLPGASNTLVTNAARRTIDSIIHNTPEVIFSHALRVEDRALGVSSLVSGFEEASVTGIAGAVSTIVEQMLHCTRQEFHLDPAVPMNSDEARGGTSILKNQAACPFRAFVTHRLVSEIPEEPEPGLDASERGTLVHALMEIIWSHLISHSGLVSTGEAELEQIVLDAARTALERFTRKKPGTLTPRFREIELERLVTMVMRWLHYEAERQAFTVLHPEIERNIELGGLQMKIFIDRIDQDDIGEHIILDYKTGKTSPSSWFGDRPDEPQLPLYAISEQQRGNQVSAICFAQIRAAEMSFLGISREKNQLPGVTSWDKYRNTKEFGSWDAILQSWQTILEKLAEAFVAGVAPVDPKSSSTCNFCELASVCRINELKHRLGITGDEEPEYDE